MATIRFDADDLLEILQSAENRAILQIRMHCAEGAKKFENYAKLNRPWTDRTGHARQRLKGYTEDHGNKIWICIAHGVDYGTSLEFEHERRYAILEPTVKHEGPAILRGFDIILKRIFKNG